MSSAVADIAAARAALSDPAATGVASAWAPGRCTILGEHVDYAGGRVLACALEIGIAVAMADSRDGRWRVRSGADETTRDVLGSALRGDIADRPLAAVEVARREGLPVPPLEMAFAASLPSGAGLSSSAAVICASLAALLARNGVRTTARRLAELAWVAEHDVLGVPCGRLDQRAVVESPRDGLIHLDCASGEVVPVAWPWTDVVLVIADSGDHHDVGGGAYASLRQAAEAILLGAGVASCQDLTADDVDRLEGPQRARARHLVDETRRLATALEALAAGDAPALGREMSAAHRGQRELLQSTTMAIDRMVRAAEAIPGCMGARMVGGGFGGSVVALCHARAAASCATVMTSAAVSPSRAWVSRPAAGLAALSPVLFVGTDDDDPRSGRRRLPAR